MLILYIIGILLAGYSIYRCHRLLKDIKQQMDVVVLMRELYAKIIIYQGLMVQHTADELEKLKISWSIIDIENDINNLTSHLRRHGIPVIFGTDENGKKYVYVEEAK